MLSVFHSPSLLKELASPPAPVDHSLIPTTLLAMRLKKVVNRRCGLPADHSGYSESISNGWNEAPDAVCFFGFRQINSADLKEPIDLGSGDATTLPLIPVLYRCQAFHPGIWPRFQE